MSFNRPDAFVWSCEVRIINEHLTVCLYVCVCVCVFVCVFVCVCMLAHVSKWMNAWIHLCYIVRQ